MRKIKFIGICITMAMMMSACGQQVEENPQELTESSVTEETDGGEVGQELLAGIIEDQSFDVELDDWGNVTFVSMAPENGIGKPEFFLMKDGEIVYTFPKAESESEDFSVISAVSFQDYNGDGKTDILVLVQCDSEGNTWNEPQIFLQEDEDNTFYLDYPTMESYRLESVSEEGPSFYRDTFLEEYLSEQELTNSIADIEGSWSDYIEHLEWLVYDSISPERQCRIYAQQRATWIDDDYMERNCYTLASLNYNGKLVLIASKSGGTGYYTYSRFFQIDDTGNVVEMDFPFTEEESQPDIIDEGELTIYSDWSMPKVSYYYVVHDMMRIAADHYVYETGAINLTDDAVEYMRLAVQEEIYSGPDDAPNVVCEDWAGNSLTKEEYDSFADSYFTGQGYNKEVRSLQWADVETIAGMNEEEAIAELERVSGIN